MVVADARRIDRFEDADEHGPRRNTESSFGENVTGPLDHHGDDRNTVSRSDAEGAAEEAPKLAVLRARSFGEHEEAVAVAKARVAPSYHAHDAGKVPAF